MFTAVSHFSGPHRKQTFSFTGSKYHVCGLLLKFVHVNFYPLIYILNSYLFLSSWFVDCCHYYLRNTCRKHVPCFYQVIQTWVEVWENEKCCGNMSCRRVFPQLFQVLPNFHECLTVYCSSIEMWSTCFLFLLENNTTRKRKTTC